MISSNNNIFELKCYLKFIEIVPKLMGGLSLLAYAINNFNSILTKKIILLTLVLIHKIFN